MYLMFDENIHKKVEDIQARLMGERYRGVSLSTYQGTPLMLNCIDQFMNKKKNFLVFCGNPGIGKTLLCACLVEWALKFRSFRYWKEIELFRRVRASIEDSKIDYQETLEFLIDDPFIMLDDIGSTGLTDWRKEIIFSAVEFRYKTMLPTLITSNLSRDDFEKKFPERVADRLFAKENIIIEDYETESFRKI